jgi:hypothetical protein
MWERIEDKLALLELLTTGILPQRSAQQEAFAWLGELPWTRATARRGELALVPERRPDLIALVERVWPAWRDDHLALVEAGHPPTPTGWERLSDARRAAAMPNLPAVINRRTAAAATAAGAKGVLTGDRTDAFGDTEVAGDGLARVRVPAGLVAKRRGLKVSLDAFAGLLDEVGIPDRALRDGLTLEGDVAAIVTVENLGAWRDMPQPPGWMLIHVPGWNTTLAPRLLALLPSVPVLHFGDLDPNGVRIYRHLRNLVPRIGWLVPDFWRELIPLHAHSGDWPEWLDLKDAPALVRELAGNGLWLEQERVVLDPRFEGEMVATLGAG